MTVSAEEPNVAPAALAPIDARARFRALALDPDAVAQRLFRRAFEAEGAEITSVGLWEQAQIELAHANFDVVLCETRIADAEGIAVLRTLRDDPRFATLPFVFVSIEARPARKVQAFAAGANDYVTKPFHGPELVARCRALVAQHAAGTRSPSALRSPRFVANASVVTPRTALLLLERARASGRLVVSHARARGAVRLVEGKITSATFAALTGERAVRVMLELREGALELHDDATPDEAFDSEISVTSLLLHPVLMTAEGVGTPRLTAPVDVRVQPYLAPSKSLSRAFDDGLADPFLLGKLEAFGAAELDAFTRTDTSDARFHVVFIADVRAAAACLLAMAAPPTPGWVARCLGVGPIALGLTFDLREGRQLDIVVLDVSRPLDLADALRRAPAAVVVAPTSGEAAELGERVLSDLQRIVASLSPTLLVALGRPSLGEALAQLPQVRAGTSALAVVDAMITDPALDLRAVLGTIARAWGSHR
jgi:DNA-binding response OmpR family regulator